MNFKKIFDLQNYSFYDKLKIFNDHKILIFLFVEKIKFTSFLNLHKKIESETIFSRIEMCDLVLSTWPVKE